jgi:tetratricopeptide (TPR) repeat protein
LAQGKYDDARDLMKSVLESFDERSKETLPFATASAQYGITLVETGHCDHASIALERAVAIFGKLQLCMSPDHADALTALGRCQLACGRFSEAAISLGEAARFWSEFDPSNRSGLVAQKWYELALAQSGERSHPEESANGFEQPT